jgi:Ca2+-binding RTX toxin-like protein
MATFRPDLNTTTPTSDDDILIGSRNGETIEGGAGADQIYGLGGDDHLSGDGNDDTLYGGRGEDSLLGGSGDDLLDGADENDVLNGGTDDDRLFGGGEADILTGGPGTDQIVGGGGDDQLIWNNGDSSDEMDGGSGTDTVQVNGADPDGDQFEVDAFGADVVFERTNLAPFRLEIENVEALEVNGLGGSDNLIVDTPDGVGDLSGTSLERVTFRGGDGNDFLNNGTFGSNIATVPLTAFGEEGSDNLRGGSDDDLLDGGDGSEFIRGEAGNDTIFGGDGSDRGLQGSEGDDTIFGGDGNDFFISGDSGNDQLSGGEGNDNFFYDATDDGQDVIQDLEPGDRIFITGVRTLDTDPPAGVLSDPDLNVAFTGTALELDFGSGNILTVVGVSELNIGQDPGFPPTGEFLFI